MRAMVIRAFGGPEVFEERVLPTPSPGPGELLVRVMATAVNPVDAKIRAGGRWAGIEPPAILGYDVSGVVEAVGPGVEDFRPGDEVYYTPEIFGNAAGSYAEYNVVRAGIVAAKPKGLDHVAAAAVPLAGGTAWEAVVRRLRLRPGESVLIHGGAGGVGHFAIQFAKAAGAYVLATSSAANLDTLRALGADVAIDYRSGDLIEAVRAATGGEGVDAVFDTVGGDTVPKSLPAVKSFGRIAAILGPSGDLTELYVRNMALYGIFLTRERRRLEEMRPLLERGQVRPLVDRVLPLEAVAEAHRRLDTGHGRGKVVLSLGGP
jgi:NADPH2:quinone reductase